MPYSATAPTTEPMVAQITASHGPNEPFAAVNPASGRISSEGMGGKMFSRNTASATPIGPIASITCTTMSPSQP